MNAEKINRCLKRLRYDRDAFTEIYNFYLPKIKKRVLFRFGQKVDFEDVAHELFTKLITGDDFHYVESPTSWIYRICDNLCIDYLKKKGQTVNIDDVPPSELICEAPETENGEFENEGFFAIISSLDERSRQVIKLRHFDGYNLKEIAVLLNIPHANVRKIYSRALKKLKKILK